MPTGKANQVLTNDGSVSSWQGLGGDLSGRPGAVTVSGLGGRKLGSLTPLDGQFLKWNANSQQWEPTTLAGAMSVFGRTGAITAQTGDYGFAQITGSVAAGQLPAAGGDLNGTLTGARVTGLQNRPVANSVPATGQVLAWDGAQWTPQTFAGGGVTSLFGRTGAVTGQAGDYSFAQISGAVGGGTTARGGRRFEWCSQRSDGRTYTKPASWRRRRRPWDKCWRGTGHNGRRRPWRALVCRVCSGARER